MRCFKKIMGLNVLFLKPLLKGMINWTDQKWNGAKIKEERLLSKKEIYFSENIKNFIYLIIVTIII